MDGQVPIAAVTLRVGGVEIDERIQCQHALRACQEGIDVDAPDGREAADQRGDGHQRVCDRFQVGRRHLTIACEHS
jgi:hypothetical protein